KRSTTVSLLQPQLLIGQVEGAARHQSPKERSGNCKRKYQTDNILGDRRLKLLIDPWTNEIQIDIEDSDQNERIRQKNFCIRLKYRFPTTFGLNVLSTD